MTGLEIALFILGVAFIIISFFIVDNSRSGKGSGMSETGISGEAIRRIGADAIEDMNHKSDLLIAESEDKLEKISNDKIIAVGEYSDQVLEKISSNHKEVVFLYQMLNEKEEELKKTATKLDNVRIECEKLIQSEVALEVHRSNDSMSERIEEKDEGDGFKFSSYLDSTYQDRALQHVDSPEAALRNVVMQSTGSEINDLSQNDTETVSNEEEFDFVSEISENYENDNEQISEIAPEEFSLDDIFEPLSVRAGQDVQISEEKNLNTEEKIFNTEKNLSTEEKNSDITDPSEGVQETKPERQVTNTSKKITDEDRRRAFEAASSRRAASQKQADPSTLAKQSGQTGIERLTGLERAAKNRTASDSEAKKSASGQDINAPAATRRDPSNTAGTKPATANTNGTKPVASNTAGTKPVTANTVATKPVVANMAGTKPITANTTGAKPVTAKTTGAKPVTSNTAGTKPVTTNTEVTKPASAGTTGTSKTSDEKTTARKKPVQSSNASVIEAEGRDNASLRRNEEIISLHRQGRSVMEISKLLRMGQGEVRLIINLYG
ncbi:MAG: hypothetical protein K6E85_06435 [Lachnospiraceae bacterium]|nr:hypothetical protein [Lachnospiraceae bacterium]